MLLGTYLNFLCLWILGCKEQWQKTDQFTQWQQKIPVNIVDRISGKLGELGLRNWQETGKQTHSKVCVLRAREDLQSTSVSPALSAQYEVSAVSGCLMYVIVYTQSMCMSLSTWRVMQRWLREYLPCPCFSKWQELITWLHSVSRGGPVQPYSQHVTFCKSGWGSQMQIDTKPSISIHSIFLWLPSCPDPSNGLYQSLILPTPSAPPILFIVM